MNDKLKQAEELILKYGNANYDCGDFNDEGNDNDYDNYKKLSLQCSELKTELLSLISQLVEENERKDIEITNLVEAITGKQL